ncbi:helix-turn-helix domain-containing protein [Streptomyces geranii]|uniref:helix-turn-helix domain-containing protein n=1 Tax=Streptomyces geranii TaxID=2058923 RepID=UPI000D041844|nr:helix-turn-helix transcriptional regulator [Streptomyces geranii]
MGEGTWGTTGGEPEISDSLRTFGAVVQALREHMGMSRKELARLVQFSEHTVASVELGRRMPDPVFVERADAALGNTGALKKAAEFLNRQPGLAAWFRRWALLEAKAISLCTYECRMLPGLLQTEAYARQLFVDELPPLSDQEIEANWIARAKRQELLRQRPNTAFSFILEEHLFRRCTGGVDVTLDLIDHVLRIAQQRNVEIQVMPLVCKSHAGLHGPLQLLETPENKWYAYTEAPESGQLISNAKVISVLQQRYARMRAQALTLEDSMSLLERMRGEL